LPGPSVVPAMSTSPAALTHAYLEHLTATDHALLLAADPDGPRPAGNPASVLSEPGWIDRALGQPALWEAVFGPDGAREPLLGASPFLVFAVAVRRVAAELASATHVSEWLSPGRRAPVFDVGPLREFLAAPWHRLFLAELLASYTHVASGSVLVSTRRGWRRQRFSELDPVRLASLLEVVPEAQRPGILRRLGDLALFLTGVFPDHVARRGFGPIEEGRLLRAGGMPLGRPEAPPGPPAWSLGDPGAVGLLELLGRRWYRAAFDLLVPPVPAAMAVVGELPERFSQARRILNLVTDRFLFHYRDQWWGPEPGPSNS
jgi:hypothetical protein